LGWGLVALLYGLAGFLAIGVIFHARRSAMGGAELALYWLALVCCIGPSVFSLYNVIVAQTLSYLPIAALALIMAVSLIAVRRSEIGGLEFAVYWFGFSLFLYAAGVSLVTSTFFRTTELGAFFEVRPNRAPAILLTIAILSALAILAWRNRRLSRPEIAVYMLGVAYWLYVLMRLGQA
jgi:hypothetical protein